MQRQATFKQSQGKALERHLSRRVREGIFICALAAALFFLISLLSYHQSDPGWSHLTAKHLIANSGGRFGAWVSDVFLFLFGYFAYCFPLFFLYGGWLVLKEDANHLLGYQHLSIRAAGLVLFFISGTALWALRLGSIAQEPYRSGGIVGKVFAVFFVSLFNQTGAQVLLIAVLLSSVTLLTGLSWLAIAERLGRFALKSLERFPEFSSLLLAKIKTFHKKSGPVIVRDPLVMTPPKLNIPKQKASKPIINPSAGAIVPSQRAQKDAQVPLFDMLFEGTMPSLSLLDPVGASSKKGFSNAKLEMMSREVEQRLLDFGVEVQVVAVHPGPVITRFEMQLAPGIKVAKISGLAKDLARSLSVTSVRIVEIIAGKSVVGLELPNEERDVVRLSEVLASQQYDQARSHLSLALGKDISGHPVIVDLAKMPHLLVAGTTGAGKSVGLNAMLLSVLYKSTPKDVRMILIDPKMLELSIYEGIPHLLTPVVTDMNDAQHALRWCVAEMERRYRLMSSLGVRNLSGYNTKVNEAIAQGKPLQDMTAPFVEGEERPTLEPLPYVLVVIDELADMMMVVGKKVEQLIARIAQKARAAGIHMILATQRPSVDVLTGLIKSNIPTRIAFQVSSKIDSRTILDQSGAEQLLGHGDMLFLAPGTAVPTRVHGAFVADHEVHRVTTDWKKRGTPVYIDDVFNQHENIGQPGDFSFLGESNGDVEDQDPLYDQAVEFVISSRKASISSVQRRFKIGYNRAARLVEEMERIGVVSAMETNGSREVLAGARED